MLFDYGVDPEAKTIRVGVNTDLSGIFTTHTLRATDGHLAYWEWVNDQGGVSGWRVEPVVMDNGYNVDTHVQNYREMADHSDDSVVMFSVSAGSSHNAAIADLLAEDEMAAVPYSRASRWADPDLGANLLEALANNCVEAMNGATYMAEAYGDKAALVTLDNAYGADGAAGLKIAAQELGLDIVYDGEGAITLHVTEYSDKWTPSPELAPVIDSIVSSGAHWVWLATDPRTTADLLNGAAAAGFAGQWSGNAASWTPLLLLTPAAPIADAGFTFSTPNQLWNVDDSEGMQEMVSVLRRYRPDAGFDDLYVNSWIQGYITTQILEQAIANGDLTRAGVLAAANQVTVDLKGLAPNPTWSGDPDDNITRATYLYDVDLSLHTPSLLSNEQLDYWLTLVYKTEGHTVLDGDANAGYRLIKGPYISEVARNWSYQPCH